MNRTAKTITLAIGDEAEVATRFRELYHDAQTGLRRVVAFGLYAWQVKLHHLRHGQWLRWCEQNVPDLKVRAIQAHMTLAESALEQCGVKSLKRFIESQIRSTLRICHSGEFLLLPDAKVPEPIKPLREKIFSLIDGKSQRQLFAEFKQSEDGEKAKIGRLKGQGGVSKAQRMAAKDKAMHERLIEIKLGAGETCKWLDEYADAAGIGLLDNEPLAKLKEACEHTAGFAGKLLRDRKGK